MVCIGATEDNRSFVIWLTIVEVGGGFHTHLFIEQDQPPQSTLSAQQPFKDMVTRSVRSTTLEGRSLERRLDVVRACINKQFAGR